jgi:hypothetical protein
MTDHDVAVATPSDDTSEERPDRSLAELWLLRKLGYEVNTGTPVEGWGYLALVHDADGAFLGTEQLFDSDWAGTASAIPQELWAGNKICGPAEGCNTWDHPDRDSCWGEECEGVLGLGVTLCALICTSSGVFGGDGGGTHWFFNVGNFGLGASADLHMTTRDACAQGGWSASVAYVAGYGGGASVGFNEPGTGLDFNNVDATVSYGARTTGSLPAEVQQLASFSGGSSCTWVSGC